ncbi:MAG: Ig-like domain-containing protein [bacterium]
MLAGCIQPQPTEQAGGAAQPPVITSVTAEPDAIHIGQSSTITCNAMDPLGDALSYRWKVDLGDIVGHGNRVRYSAAYCCTGVNEITVIVSNSKGGSATGRVKVTVAP